MMPRHCVAPLVGSMRRPAYEDSSDKATSSGEDSDSPKVAEHWKKRHTGVLVESAWAAACWQVERALWSELVARAVSELDVEAATEHAQAAAAAASLPPSEEARASRLVTRVVGRFDTSDDDGGSRASGGGSDSDSGPRVRTAKTATDLYRASKARSVADAELLRPRVAPERAQPHGRENREGAIQVSGAGAAPLVQLPHRPRGWPREWSSSWAKVHHRRRHAPAALQPAAQALLAQDDLCGGDLT